MANICLNLAVLTFLMTSQRVSSQRIGPLDGYMKAPVPPVDEEIELEATPKGQLGGVPSKDLPQYPLFIDSPKARIHFMPPLEGEDNGGEDPESNVYFTSYDYYASNLFDFDDAMDRTLSENLAGRPSPSLSNQEQRQNNRKQDESRGSGEKVVRHVVSGSDQDGNGADWLEASQDGTGMLFHSMWAGNRSATCRVIPTDATIHHKVEEHIALDAKVINYRLSFKNYSSNPMENTNWIYKPTVWTRVSTYHGQTLVSLAFNYGILSLMTLTFGVVSLPVEFRDDPPGCFGRQSEENKTKTLLEILVRDFQIEEDAVMDEPNSVCYKPILKDGGYVNFQTNCCRLEYGGMIECRRRVKNIWLHIIDSILSALIFVVLLFGPMYSTGPIAGRPLESIPYTVKLKQSIQRKICIIKGADQPRTRVRRTLDLRKTELFSKGKSLLADLPLHTVIPIKIDQFDIDVHYDHLQKENKINVGMKNSLFRAIFSCELRHIGPFKACCQVNMFEYLKELPEVPWIAFWRVVGKLLLVLLVPSPYYLRLLIYYHFEHPEIQQQLHIVHKLGLSYTHEFNILHYLTPTHPWLISVYLVYFITVLFFVLNQNDAPHYKNILVNSFKDLSKLSWLRAFGNVVERWLWPFSRFGCVGVVLAPFYWAVMLPVYITLYLLYCTPLIYLLCRIIFRAMPLLFIRRTRVHRRSLTPGGWKQELRKILNTLEHTLLLQDEVPDDPMEREDDRQAIVLPPIGVKHFIYRVIGISLLVYNIIGIAVIVSECVGFMAKTFAFTLMGVVVNASTVLKYVTLIILIVIYSYDCYNNVYEKYLKLNKSLFSEIKGRMSDQIDAVTSLPAHLQENRGFKTVENDEQAEHEDPDEVALSPPLHWELNDLIMFIDNDDMPRIPKKLFKEVCSIRVSGSPGPIYRSLLQATGKFLTLFTFLLFIFMVVLSFGEVYNISSTNQMLATLAGGFVPFIMRTMMTPSKPDTELATVSFKSKLDEIIQNFRQTWPMNDFTFQVETPGSSAESDTLSVTTGNDVTGQADVLGSSLGTTQLDQMTLIRETSSADNSSYKSFQQIDETGESHNTSLTGSTLVPSCSGSTSSLLYTPSTMPLGLDNSLTRDSLENSYSSARNTTPTSDPFFPGSSPFQYPISPNKHGRESIQSVLDSLNNRINCGVFGTHTVDVHRASSRVDLNGSRSTLGSFKDLSPRAFGSFADSKMEHTDGPPPPHNIDSTLPAPVIPTESGSIKRRPYFSQPLITLSSPQFGFPSSTQGGAVTDGNKATPPGERMRKLTMVPKLAMNPLFKPASRGDTVDILIILPESEVQDPMWCKRWSDLFIYQSTAPRKQSGIVPL